MTERADALTIEATRVIARVPLTHGADAAPLAVATALRLFARYPVLDHFTLRAPGGDLEVSRDQAEAWLAPDGLAGVDDPEAWPALLARATEAFRSSASGRAGGQDARTANT